MAKVRPKTQVRDAGAHRVTSGKVASRAVYSMKDAIQPQAAFPVKTATADEKGRVTLGQSFANATFIVRRGKDATEIILTVGHVIPERELWLYKNPEALRRVLHGIAQAHHGKLATNPPDIQAECEALETLGDSGD